MKIDPETKSLLTILLEDHADADVSDMPLVAEQLGLEPSIIHNVAECFDSNSNKEIMEFLSQYVNRIRCTVLEILSQDCSVMAMDKEPIVRRALNELWIIPMISSDEKLRERVQQAIMESAGTRWGVW